MNTACVIARRLPLSTPQTRYDLRPRPFHEEDAHAKVMEEADRLLGQQAK